MLLPCYLTGTRLYRVLLDDFATIRMMGMSTVLARAVSAFSSFRFPNSILYALTPNNRAMITGQELFVVRLNRLKAITIISHMYM